MFVTVSTETPKHFSMWVTVGMRNPERYLVFPFDFSQMWWFVGFFVRLGFWGFLVFSFFGGEGVVFFGCLFADFLRGLGVFLGVSFFSAK